MSKSLVLPAALALAARGAAHAIASTRVSAGNKAAGGDVPLSAPLHLFFDDISRKAAAAVRRHDMTRLVHLAGAALLLGTTASPAFAHAMLRKSIPAVGATVHAVPSDVVLLFSEGVEPAFSSIEVHDASGVRVNSGHLHTAPGDDKTLIVAVTLRAPGTYTVEWHATSVDTHKTQGRFSFTLAP